MNTFTPPNHIGGRSKNGPCVYGYFNGIPLIKSDLSYQLDNMLSDTNHKINKDETSEIIIDKHNSIHFENHEKNYIIAERSIFTEPGTKYLGKSVVGDHISYFCVIKLDRFEDKESVMFANITNLYKAISEFNQL